MSDTRPLDLADSVIAELQRREGDLRQAGVAKLSLFGSVARGDHDADSDVDLAAEFNPSADVDLFQLMRLERTLTEWLERPVHLLPEPV